MLPRRVRDRYTLKTESSLFSVAGVIRSAVASFYFYSKDERARKYRKTSLSLSLSLRSLIVLFLFRFFSPLLRESGRGQFNPPIRMQNEPRVHLLRAYVTCLACCLSSLLFRNSAWIYRPAGPNGHFTDEHVSVSRTVPLKTTPSSLLSLARLPTRLS